jgi:chemotaxis protein MotA
LKANTAIGIAGAIGCLLFAVIMEGGNPAALINIPALLIVIGGTSMATFASSSMEQMKRLPTLYKKAFSGSDLDARAAIATMVGLADKARREGLLALENELDGLPDEYSRKGIQLVIDGTDSDLVRTILQSELDGMMGRHRANAKFFATAGGFAPTLGILGTVLSLVHVLENLSSPRTLGHSIAGAFLATLYGVGSANIIFLPVSNKLKELSTEEVLYRELLLEGVLSIQAGENPRILADRLSTFLPPGDRKAKATAAAAAEQAPDAGPAQEAAAA